MYIKFFSNSAYRYCLNDISNYLNISFEEILKRAKIKDTLTEEKIWNKKERKTIEDYRNYYSENKHYLERQDYYNLNHIPILREFRNLNINSNVLDYGCGTAYLAVEAKIKRLDLNIYLADISEALTKKFVFWRFKRKKLSFTWIDIPTNEELQINTSFDLIRCHDVFEHSFYPLKIIKFFHKKLNYNGYLSFDYLINDDLKKETTYESQQQRSEVINFVYNNFEILYKYKNKFVVKKNIKNV